MERRGRIPIATFRTAEGKPRSRSRAREINISYNDPEMDTFTLLEENFALKEENEKLKIKITEYVENIKQLEEDNLQLRIKIKDLNNTKPEKLIDLQVSGPAPFRDSKLLHKSIQNNTCQSDDLYSSVTKKKTEKFKQFILHPSNEFESLLDVKTETPGMVPLRSVQGLLSAFSQLKANYNSVELQLYEANEKISELLESISQTCADDHSAIVDNQSASYQTNNKGQELPVLSQNANLNYGVSEIGIEQKSPEDLVEKETLRGERIVEV